MISEIATLTTAFIEQLPAWAIVLYALLVVWASIYTMLSVAPPNPDLRLLVGGNDE